ncbi:hypothetical protein WN55_11252 [Dufourea novaeangliae]|uniref:Uncharacterized protein n=1 Tax=Dufourea novaeangliae TaxID=178035 RepID=A0A154P9U0_DUFNO|nr:hypothetical protein WN55_11252 [Dufourea novaeangliae]
MERRPEGKEIFANILCVWASMGRVGTILTGRNKCAIVNSISSHGNRRTYSEAVPGEAIPRYLCNWGNDVQSPRAQCPSRFTLSPLCTKDTTVFVVALIVGVQSLSSSHSKGSSFQEDRNEVPGPSQLLTTRTNHANSRSTGRQIWRPKQERVKNHGPFQCYIGIVTEDSRTSARDQNVENDQVLSQGRFPWSMYIMEDIGRTNEHDEHAEELCWSSKNEGLGDLFLLHDDGGRGWIDCVQSVSFDQRRIRIIVGSHCESRTRGHSPLTAFSLFPTICFATNAAISVPAVQRTGVWTETSVNL